MKSEESLICKKGKFRIRVAEVSWRGIVLMPKSVMILRKVFREQECNKQEMA
jgi:hydrogenase maturation factor